MRSALALDDLTRLGAVAEAAARLGGAVVADHFGRLTAGHSKAPGDYVSEVDLASEETIRVALERDAPDIPFFGEEGGGTRGDLWWVVDPLDGTANFLHGFPVVGVSVALVEAGRPVAGADPGRGAPVRRLTRSASRQASNLAICALGMGAAETPESDNGSIQRPWRCTR